MTEFVDPGKPIHLCVLDESTDDAHDLAAALENSNKSIRVSHVTSKQALCQAIDINECDVIAAVPLIKRFDAFKAVETIEALNHHAPVIGIRKKGSELDVVEAMRNGLVDLVDFDNHEHLMLVIERELRHRVVGLPVAGGRGERDFTGLYSRMHFLDLLQAKLDDSGGKSNSLALLYVQLDSFSWINENIGIAAADQFLKSIAAVILDNVGAKDIPARYHGGTFVILIHGFEVNELENKAYSLGSDIANHVFEHQDQAVSSTCSIGMSLVSELTGDCQDLITHAFNACENAKASGGNCVEWFSTPSTAQGHDGDPVAWITRIRQAFENDMFSLLFQPIISLKGHKTPRYEVLLRMKNENGDTILPGAFLPYAERAGLMTDIDRWVITHAIAAAKDLLVSGIEPEVYLKLSGKALTDNSMSAWISHALNEADCPGEVIVFEITESLAITHIAQTRLLISWLKQLGCKIGLDHFGATPNSLRLLDRLEVDYLKIDGSLIRGLATDESHKLQVKKIVDKARGMGIGTIAESVQNASSLPIIWKYGVEYIQGYFLQEPEAEMGYDFSQLVF